MDSSLHLMFVRPPAGLSISPEGEGEGEELGQQCLPICEDEWLAPGQACVLSSVDFEGRALRFPRGKRQFPGRTRFKGRLGTGTGAGIHPGKGGWQ